MLQKYLGPLYKSIDIADNKADCSKLQDVLKANICVHFFSMSFILRPEGLWEIAPLKFS